MRRRRLPGAAKGVSFGEIQCAPPLPPAATGKLAGMA